MGLRSPRRRQMDCVRPEPKLRSNTDSCLLTRDTRWVVTEKPEPRSARQTINDMLDAGLLDELMDRVDAGELALTGGGRVPPGDGQSGARARPGRRADRAPGYVPSASHSAPSTRTAALGTSWCSPSAPTRPRPPQRSTRACSAGGGATTGTPVQSVTPSRCAGRRATRRHSVPQCRGDARRSS